MKYTGGDHLISLVANTKLIHVPIFCAPKAISDADRIVLNISKSTVTRSFINEFDYNIFNIKWSLIVYDWLSESLDSKYINKGGDHYFNAVIRIKGLADALKSAVTLYAKRNMICPLKANDYLDSLCDGLDENFKMLVNGDQKKMQNTLSNNLSNKQLIKKPNNEINQSPAVG